jgi:hypothetical protein
LRKAVLASGFTGNIVVGPISRAWSAGEIALAARDAVNPCFGLTAP